MRPLFPLGNLYTTRGALALFTESGDSRELVNLIARHASGDWGDVPPEDALANVTALTHRLRILSSYPVGEHRVWIITEADRSSTTVLRPDEY